MMKNKKIIFIIEESLEGGYETSAISYSIFTEAETEEELKQKVLEAVRCYFEEDKIPSLIILRYQRENYYIHHKKTKQILDIIVSY